MLQSIADLDIASILAASPDGDNVYRLARGNIKKSRKTNEGLLLIKPGGTFNEATLTEIFRRIFAFPCGVLGIRVYGGQYIACNDLFEKQYPEPTKLATGTRKLDKLDYDRARSFYDVPEFRVRFGHSYSPELIVGATAVERKYNLSPSDVSQMWDSGRKKDLFHNHRFDGLNKIGFQKSVFPISIGSEVVLILNGYVPGYRALFEDFQNRVVAVWLTTDRPWADVRDRLVGGQSAPHECKSGSIRRDAYANIIPIENSHVDGQRNVVHASANLVEASLELVTWFEVKVSDTLFGDRFQDRVRDVDIRTLWTAPGHTFVETRDDDLRATIDACIKEIWYIQTENEGRSQVFNDLLNALQNSTGLSTGTLARDGVIRTLVSGGVDLNLAGKRLFKNATVRGLLSEVAAVYSQAANVILDQWTRDEISSEIAAEAVRICASDAYLVLRNETFFPPELIDEIGATMAEQAISSAMRIYDNACAEIRIKLGLFENEAVIHKEVMVATMAESEAWREFLATDNARPIAVPPDCETVGLILAGGRSTRVRTTVPKALLPVGKEPMLNMVLRALQASTCTKIFCAVGWRNDLMAKILGKWDSYLDVEPLVYSKTPGLGLRVATCLHQLREFHGNIVIAYCDMPGISPVDIIRLLDQVKTEDAIAGILTARTDRLSGHIQRLKSRVSGVVQGRMDPNFYSEERDYGVNVFRNSSLLRETLLGCRNDNPRREYILADVFSALHRSGLPVADVDAKNSIMFGVDTPQDLVLLGSGLHKRLGNCFETQRIGPSIAEAFLLSYNLPIGADEIAKDVAEALTGRFRPVLFLR